MTDAKHGIELPLDVWTIIIYHIAAYDTAHAAHRAQSTLRRLAATSKDLQSLCHGHIYRRLDLEWLQLLRPIDQAAADIELYHRHATELAFDNNRDLFSMPRWQRMATVTQEEMKKADEVLAGHIGRLSPRLDSFISNWLLERTVKALRGCQRLREIVVTGDATNDGCGEKWPMLMDAVFIRCGLATAALFCSSAPALRKLHLSRMATGKKGDALPETLWSTLVELEVQDMNFLDISDILQPLRKIDSPGLRHLSMDCSSANVDDLHTLLDLLSSTHLTSFEILSSPDSESAAGRGGHILFTHLASALPHLRRLVFMRGNGYEVVPFIAKLVGYAEALAPCQELAHIVLNHSNSFHGPGEEKDAEVFAARLPSLRFVTFRGKVSMSATQTYRISRSPLRIDEV